MALLKRRNATTWLIRTLGALMVALAALAGVTSQAFAHDDDNNETVTYGPNACTVVADLPPYPNATCIKHKSELDDGVAETKNSYAVPVAADTVRQSFEATFQTYGWTVVEAEQDTEDSTWEYSIAKTGRQLEVKVEAQEPDEGTGTEFSFTEK